MINKFFTPSIFFFCSFLLSFSGYSQINTAHVPLSIQKAIQQGTRTDNGVPGSDYWQNQTDYTIDVSFEPESRKISGTAHMVYTNNSPDTLTKLLIMLFPDLYKKGNPRDFVVEATDEHPGISLFDFTINSIKINTSRTEKEMLFFDTYALVDLQSPFLPGSTNELKISWEYTLNSGSHMRTGQVGDHSYFIAYWFPRIGVYDDIEGWNSYNYTGTTEFYNDFGNFDVNIHVPDEYIVWATGELQNPEDLFSKEVLQRYKLAHQSSEITPIISPTDLMGKNIIKGKEAKTWRYKANHVMDFAFALSDQYLWDATSLEIGKGGEKIFLSTAYPENSPDFTEVIHMAKKSMVHMVEELPALAFPYPCMTIFNGLDEMEYPMLVNNHSFTNLDETFKLTAHEIYHSYFPFSTGCNERKYAWMDEGLTSFFEYNLMKKELKADDISIYFIGYYLSICGTEKDLPLITPSEIIPAPDYYAISYAKAACVYNEVMDELGKEKFNAKIKVFSENWEGKHPSGFDLINAFISSGESKLEGILTPWFFEYGYVDLGILQVSQEDEYQKILLENKGIYPAGFDLFVTYSGKEVETIHYKPSVWLTQKDQFEIRLEGKKEILSLEIRQNIPTDVNPSDNIYRNDKKK